MRFQTRHILQLLPLLAVSSTALSRGNAITFDHLSLERGLSQSTVNAIVQDGQGFLWFGTQDGLNKYDGYTLTIYKHSPTDSFSISDNGIWALCKDRTGDIWIGTMRGGLNRFSVEQERFFHYRHDPADSGSISEDNVTSVFQDSRGTIWAGTLSNGLNAFDPATGRFHQYRHGAGDSTSLAGNTVWAIAEDRKGSLWIATWCGLCRFLPPKHQDHTSTERHNGSFLHYQPRPHSRQSLAGSTVRSLLADREGRLWIGTWGSGLDRLDPVTGSVLHYVHDTGNDRSLSSNQILSLLDTDNGYV